jgi:hypothetical protein
MSWKDIMRRVLPQIDNVDPDITSRFGAVDGRPPGSSRPHRGVDFNYFAHDRINRSHPVVRAPVTSVVTRAGEGGWGTIAIRDANGYSHEILHSRTQHVSAGDPVAAGQIIGTMGNAGLKRKTPEDGVHVHYQLRNPAGNVINPTEYWDQQGRIDPNPAPPARLDDYQRYLATPGAVTGDTVASAPTAGSQTVDPADAAAEARKNVRVLGRLVPGRADLGGAPTATPNQIPSPDGPPTFDERFGSWASSPMVTAPLDPYQSIVPQPQSDKPPGIVTGRPMPNIPLPPWLFGLPDPSETPGDEAWSLGRLGRANWSRE